MKCPECNGVAYDEVWTCEVCNGKGVVEPLTNEEYLKSCNTEQLAEILFQEYCNGRNDATTGDWEGVDTYVEWLKQPHRGEP